jgi:hypothetical protein
VTLARPEGREPDNCSAIALMPLIKRPVILRNNKLQRVRRDRNFKVISVRRLNKYVIAAQLNFGRLPPKITWSHPVHSPRSKTTERFGNERDKLNRGNPVTSLTWVRAVPFLPTAPFPRRAAEPFRRNARETTAA